MPKQVMTFDEFEQEMEKLEGCVVKRVYVDKYDNGVCGVVISDECNDYTFWSPVLDHDIIGTLPIAVERFEDGDINNPVELVVEPRHEID